MSNLEKGIQCSFCNSPRELVNTMIASPIAPSVAYICDKCVATCFEMLAEKLPIDCAETLYGINRGDLDRMESMGFITLETIHQLNGSVGYFLAQLKNELVIAKRKLEEIDKTELDDKITKLSKEVSEEEQGLESKKAELESLKKKLAKTSGEKREFVEWVINQLSTQ